MSRTIAIETAIARIMKLRRQMTHHELVDNVITDLTKISDIIHIYKTSKLSKKVLNA